MLADNYTATLLFLFIRVWYKVELNYGRAKHSLFFFFQCISLFWGGSEHLKKIAMKLPSSASVAFDFLRCIVCRKNRVTILVPMTTLSSPIETSLPKVALRQAVEIHLAMTKAILSQWILIVKFIFIIISSTVYF